MFKRLFALALSLSLIAVSFCGCSTSLEQKYVAVITKSTTSEFWQAVSAGVNAASSEYNLKYTFQGPDNEEDYEAQNQMIEKAIADKANVIIFSAVDYNKSVEEIEKARDLGIYVVIIDSDINSNKVNIRISTDNYKAGQMAGNEALKIAGDKLNLGIVNFDVNSANGQQREQGFRDTVAEDSRVSVMGTVNVQSNVESSIAGTKNLIASHPEINVIATFNEWTTLGVGYAIQQLGLQDKISVIAFDNNIVSVGMLETGEIDALIVQNPFAIGYLGMESAYNLIIGKSHLQSNLYTDTTAITKANMYDESNQKILFPYD